jgi:molybdate transport system substrate-binding protein
MQTPRALHVVLRVAVLLLAAASAADSAAPAGTVTAFAAASLTESFSVVGKILEQRNPGTRVSFNFAGSQALASQIEQGARADVFASADHRWMDHVRQRGLLAGAPSAFARNRLVVIIPRSNPGRITRLQDLANGGVKVVLAAQVVPVGQYSREVLLKLSRASGFPADYAERVLRNLVSEEENVRGVVAKVVLGEADAGIVYSTDVTRATAERVQVLTIDDRYNVIASYPIAVLRDAPNPDGGRQFVTLVLSSLGQRALREYNFVPVVNP